MKRRWKLLLLIFLGLGLICLHSQDCITTEALLSWQPENLFLAALLLLVLYAVKSVLVFIPIMIPQMLAGHLYSRELALLINLLDLMVVMTVPYCIGRRMGSGGVEKLLKKFPKLQAVLNMQDHNQMALCFILRSCAVPPADIVTMYLGATGMPFHINVIGGVLGCLPYMVLTTFLGTNIRNPESPAFWKTLAVNVIWILLSGLGFWLMRKSHSDTDIQ